MRPPDLRVGTMLIINANPHKVGRLTLTLEGRRNSQKRPVTKMLR